MLRLAGQLPRAVATGTMAVVALSIVVTTIIGIVRHYSPVPFWDMWNGYLEFFFRTAHEGWQPWWELHNEHRLVLAKAFFWLDLRLFNGSLAFLFALNAVFVGLIFIVFSSWMHCLKPQRLAGQPLFWLLMCLAFSWMQHENFTWAFQSQFYMAYLLPLLAFFCLSVCERHKVAFTLALVLGVASAFTMANGLLALPLLCMQAAFQRLGWWRCILMLGTTVLVMLVYFTGYQSPAWHTPWSETLSQSPGQVLVYFLSYLGGPLYALLGEWSKWPAMFAGLLLIAGSVWLASPLVLWRRLPALELGLLVFILFIGGTALSTALGRAGLDANFAHFLPSRYMTPALMAWSAFALLCCARLKCWSTPPTVLASMLAGTLLLTAQTSTMQDTEHLLHRRAAVLATYVGVNDADYVARIYFDAERLRQLILQTVNEQVSVALMPEIEQARRFLGQPWPTNTETRSCIGYIDQVKQWPMFEGQEHGLRVEGWLIAGEKNTVPGQLVAVHDGIVTGMGITGIRRSDVALVHGQQATHSGFVLWLPAGDLRSGSSLTLAGLQPECTTDLLIP